MEFKFRSLVWDKDNTQEWVIPADNPFPVPFPIHRQWALFSQVLFLDPRLNPHDRPAGRV